MKKVYLLYGIIGLWTLAYYRYTLFFTDWNIAISARPLRVFVIDGLFLQK